MHKRHIAKQCMRSTGRSKVGTCLATPHCCHRPSTAETVAEHTCCLEGKGTWATPDTDAAAARAIAALAAAMPRMPTPAWQQPLVAGRQHDAESSAAAGDKPFSRTADAQVKVHSGHMET
jgi:hypothetical protein